MSKRKSFINARKRHSSTPSGHSQTVQKVGGVTRKQANHIAANNQNRLQKAQQTTVGCLPFILLLIIAVSCLT